MVCKFYNRTLKLCVQIKMAIVTRDGTVLLHKATEECTESCNYYIETTR